MDISQKIKSIKFSKINKLNKNELKKILIIRNEKKVRDNMINNNIISYPEHIKWFAAKIKNVHDTEFFKIIVKKQIIGLITLSNVDKKNRSLEWAFYISKNFQNFFGALIEFKFLEYLFKNYKYLNKLNCKVLSFNEPVIKLHQRFGFKIEGEIRDYLIRDKKYYNLIYMGIKKKEYLKNSKTLKKKPIFKMI